jgi:hypothetical protein
MERENLAFGRLDADGRIRAKKVREKSLSSKRARGFEAAPRATGRNLTVQFSG